VSAVYGHSFVLTILPVTEFKFIFLLRDTNKTNSKRKKKGLSFFR
ncbi:21836_t:CDS:2, partial [Gigaspora rosea]